MVDILLRLHIICLSRKKIAANEAACSDGSPEKRMWNTIWHENIPNKIKHFIWRSCKNILPTKRNLVKKKVVANDICELCRWNSCFVVLYCGENILGFSFLKVAEKFSSVAYLEPKKQCLAWRKHYRATESC